jgi:hypothetical protein
MIDVLYRWATWIRWRPDCCGVRMSYVAYMIELVMSQLAVEDLQLEVG